jgi:hypothetical protein
MNGGNGFPNKGLSLGLSLDQNRTEKVAIIE